MSVATADEADLAVLAGADLVDLKDPTAGALGRLPEPVASAAVARVAGRRPVSATIGDLPPSPDTVVAAVRGAAALGVDLVKVGLFPGPGSDATLRALGEEAARGVRLVAVVLADRDPDLDIAPLLRRLGFAGAMLDTADKRGGGLRELLDDDALGRFVGSARAEGLLVGLAGSLALQDLPALAALEPDHLGLRGAVCAGGREGPLDPGRLAAAGAALRSGRSRAERS